MSEQVPSQHIFIVDAKVALRADNEKDAQDKIAYRLGAVGPNRDSSVEMSYPRTMVPSTPLFSALTLDGEAKSPAPRLTQEQREALEAIAGRLTSARKQFIVDGGHVHPNIDPAECAQVIADAEHTIRALLAAPASGAEKERAFLEAAKLLAKWLNEQEQRGEDEALDWSAGRLVSEALVSAYRSMLDEGDEIKRCKRCGYPWEECRVYKHCPDGPLDEGEK